MSHFSDGASHIAINRVERLLNAAILGVDIREGFEEYLAIFDAYYADDIEACSQRPEGNVTVTGKAAVRRELAAFLLPLHIFAEIGGLIASVHAEPIHSDERDEMHSRWTLDLKGVNGKRCVRKWLSCRRWREGRVIYERHGEIEQTGGPLTEDDLRSLPWARGGDEFIH